MKRLALLSLTTLLISACALPMPRSADVMDHDMMDEHDHGSEEMTMDPLERLNSSPRHHEWAEVERDGKTIYTWVVYPEVSENAPVVILIHENRGLNDWARSMADQVAEAGYIAVAPDLLSGFSEEYTRTSDFPDEDAARNAIGELDLEEVGMDLEAVAEFAKAIPAGNGKLVSAGFCWGGARSFQFATLSNDLEAALVFYGTGPENAEDYAKISAPVYGFYGEDDQRVNATIETSEQYMSEAGKTYDYEIYDDAGHAFMRTGEDSSNTANAAARNAAFTRMQEILENL